MAEAKPKAVSLKEMPENVWEKINEMKIAILTKNKKRGNVSTQEAIYKLILNNCS